MVLQRELMHRGRVFVRSTITNLCAEVSYCASHKNRKMAAAIMPKGAASPRGVSHHSLSGHLLSQPTLAIQRKHATCSNSAVEAWRVNDSSRRPLEERETGSGGFQTTNGHRAVAPNTTTTCHVWRCSCPHRTDIQVAQEALGNRRAARVHRLSAEAGSPQEDDTGQHSCS